jgi:DNA-damage-inducible protein J
MATSEVVRARIDGRIKEEASAVLAAMGLTVSDAFRILLTRVAREKALPFEPLIPNDETVAAMLAARRGETEPVNVEQLRSELDAPNKPDQGIQA